jgi:glutathione S-transferase
LWLLEELGAAYETEIVDIRAPGGAPESYRAIQPNKKVPAIVHDGVIVTERAAITTYLADAFPAAGLAPAIGDSRRGPYLTAIAYVDGVADPCIAARAQGLAYDGHSFSFGTFEDMAAHLERRLAAHAYAVGDSFTAADTQIGSAVFYGLNVLGVLPDRPTLRNYLGRITARPAFQRAMAA